MQTQWSEAFCFMIFLCLTYLKSLLGVFSLLGLVCKDKRRREKIKVTAAKDRKLKTKWRRRGSQAARGVEA